MANAEKTSLRDSLFSSILPSLGDASDNIVFGGLSLAFCAIYLSFMNSPPAPAPSLSLGR